MPSDEHAQVRFLESLKSAEGWPVLVQATEGALYRGANPSGVDYYCGVCHTSLLAENVVEGEILDVAFECRACGSLCASPRLKPGDPIPRPPIVLHPRRYRIASKILGGPRTVLLGVSAARRRDVETGSDSEASRLGKSLSLGNPRDLREMIDRARRLLGPLFDTLRERDLRGRSTPRTPPKLRHRMMEMLDSAEIAVRNVEQGRPFPNVFALVELNMVLGLFERWQRDPGIGRIVKEFENPASYAHAVITLAAASHLTDAYNGIALAAPDSLGKRTPDLWIATGPSERLGMEVKAPVILQKRTKRISAKEAKEIVEQCLRKAGTGPGGQLGAERSGILLIGGFQLSRNDIGLLERAAEREVRRRLAQRKHIMAIAVASVNFLLENAKVSVTRLIVTESSRAYAMISYRLAINPGYAGNLRFSDSVSPVLRPIDERAMQEMEWSDTPPEEDRP